MKTRIGTRGEVWLLNFVARAGSYVAERMLPLSVPTLMHQDAIQESFAHARERMKGAYSFLDRYEGLSLSIEIAKQRFPSRKRILEFGVFKGDMINHQAKRFPELGFVGFDSFEGLREDWPGMLPKGAFNLAGRMPRARPNVSFVKGFFDASFPQWIGQQTANEPPLLVHVDCDTYQSTVDVLNLCSPYVSEGLIFHFDDYFGFLNWQSAGYKALSDIAEREGWKLEYISYGAKEVAFQASR
jgi:hypothetical protein